jgi:hypothetical protein
MGCGHGSGPLRGHRLASGGLTAIGSLMAALDTLVVSTALSRPRARTRQAGLSDEDEHALLAALARA